MKAYSSDGSMKFLSLAEASKWRWTNDQRNRSMPEKEHERRFGSMAAGLNACAGI